MKSIVCFGEALIDFLPLAGADPREPRTFQQHAGGAPANVAVAIARLGAKAEFIGMLGADMFGDFLLDSLQQAGVGTLHVQRTAAAPTALAFVALDEHGERSFSFYRSPAADLLFREAQLSAGAFESARIFHACSNSLTDEGMAQTTLSSMRRARAAGVLVSFDMNLRPALWATEIDPGPRLWNALAQADVIKLSAEELAFLAAPLGAEAAALQGIWNGVAELIVVTDGARALRWFTRHSSGTLEPFDVRVIDSTAAGDAFTGGMLHELARRGIDASSLAAFTTDTDALAGVLRFAAACGALAVTRRGAFSAMATRCEVETFIEHATSALRETIA